MSRLTFITLGLFALVLAWDRVLPGDSPQVTRASTDAPVIAPSAAAATPLPDAGRADPPRRDAPGADTAAIAAALAATEDTGKAAGPELLVVYAPDAPADSTWRKAAPDPAQEIIQGAIAQPENRRRVTGSRVNVRNGPGTGFAVLTQVTRNEDVQLLQDPGTGWVKIRRSSGAIGWMSGKYLATVN